MVKVRNIEEMMELYAPQNLKEEWDNTGLLVGNKESVVSGILLALDLTSDVIDAIAECDKLCEQIHLPVQAGSNTLLRRMNRNYTREKYLELMKEIKAKIPDVSITTDIIIGFPGETEEEFEDTLSLVKEVEYDSAFTFLYSIRQGTPAAKLENQVDEETTKLVENGAKINNVDFGDKVVLKDSLVLLNEKAGISEAVFYVDEYKITYNLIGTTVTKLGEEMREGE